MPFPPTASPSYAPTAAPTYAPTASPTAAPTAEPTVIEEKHPDEPLQVVTLRPTAAPTALPTAAPSPAPTATTPASTASPTEVEYQIGDRVERIEDRDVTAATVIEIQNYQETTSLLLQYDEGGMGWWPSTNVRLIERRPSNGRRLRRGSA